MPEYIKYIKVTELPIRFGQFLKLADLVQDGFEAKMIIQAGEVLVNGIRETRRGKKLKSGDRVIFGENIFEIVKGD